MRWALQALLAAVVALSGCAAGVRVVDAEVQTTAARAPGAAVLSAARYRLEPGLTGVGQLPPARLDGMAEAALARVGLVRDEAAGRLSVQASAQVNAYWAYDWGTPMGYGRSGLSFGLGVGRGFRGGGFGLALGGPLMDTSIPAYVSEVRLLMRDVQTGQIVYDTRARHDGPWHDTENVLAALLAASLQGFPDVTAPVRRVQVPLIPAGVAAPAAPALPATVAPPPVR